MKFLSVLATAATAITAVTANAVPRGYSNTVPGYPWGNGFCLTDSQAQFIVKTFAGILTNTDRNAANKTAQAFIADGYTETSDSIDILAGIPLGSSTFTSKQAYISSLLAAPPVPSFTTLDIFHDCNKISWRWNIASLGLSTYPIKGINDMQANPSTGQLKSNNLEFNSIAWGTDIGWTCTPPPSGPPQ